VQAAAARAEAEAAEEAAAAEKAAAAGAAAGAGAAGPKEAKGFKRRVVKIDEPHCQRTSPRSAFYMESL
jgi:hypothetical protein